MPLILSSSLLVMTILNMKDHFVPNMAFEIPFLSHLMRWDGVVREMATCCVLIG